MKAFSQNSLILVGLILTVPGFAQEQQTVAGSQHEHHAMSVDDDGVVMNENHSKLPSDCDEISQDHEFTIYAGRDYANNQPGMIFGMSQHEVRVEPCSRVHVTFINEDSVRHQWMIHALPKYLYPAGMFHIEVAGGKRKTGTLVVPGGDKTYLIHCDLAQHMEKGMRGQLVVGKGSGDLWSVPAISEDFIRSSYLPANLILLILLAVAAGIVLTKILSQKTIKRG